LWRCSDLLQEGHFALAVAEDDGVLEMSAGAQQPAQGFALVAGSAAGGNCICAMVVAAVAGFDTSTRTGLCRSYRRLRWISGGMVAVRSSVWR